MGNWKILDMIHTVSTGEVITVYSAYEVEDTVTAVRKVFENEFSADPSDPGYIPYEDLTEAIVIGWVKDALGTTVVSDTEAEVQAAFDVKKQEIENPTEADGLPWVEEEE